LTVNSVYGTLIIGMSNSGLQSRSRLSWRAWLAWFLIEFLVSAFFAVWLLLAILPRPRMITPCSGNGFWISQLLGHAFELRGTKTERVIWAVGRHGGSCLTTSRAEAASAFADSVRRYVDDLISDRVSWNEATGHDLQLLTGQMFGINAEGWRRWWDTEKDRFVPADDVVMRLVESRMSQGRAFVALAMPGLSCTERTVSAEAQYQKALWWSRWRGTVTTTPIVGLVVSLIGFPLLRRRWSRPSPSGVAA
jgi:hypothetical protein